jgi:hypothetical protein
LETITVNNPFNVTLNALVTQPLFSDVTILGNGGTVESSAIVWTNTIAPGSSVSDAFEFQLSALPGSMTNLPGPFLTLTDASLNSTSVQGIAEAFVGLARVQAFGTVPQGKFGLPLSLQLWVTNWSGLVRAGSLSLYVTNGVGQVVTAVTQEFAVSPFGAVLVNFMAQTNLAIGNYEVAIYLNIDGGRQQMLTALYGVPMLGITLSAGLPGEGTNGFGLTLNGPSGSNYLIETSPDLLNWTPFLSASPPRLPWSFVDLSWTNFNQRFYRAIIPYWRVKRSDRKSGEQFAFFLGQANRQAHPLID